MDSRWKFPRSISTSCAGVSEGPARGATKSSERLKAAHVTGEPDVHRSSVLDSVLNRRKRPFFQMAKPLVVSGHPKRAWYFRWSAFADGVLTVPELKAMPSLRM